MSEDATAKAKPQRRPKSHHVHVIELDDRVGNSGKFRRCNPSIKSANLQITAKKDRHQTVFPSYCG